MAKNTNKFDPNEVSGLLEKAKAGDIVARDELLFRFQRLVATLVNVCVTGRPNFWSSYQITFLKMFTGKKDVHNTASMLKFELADYEAEELFSTGQLAILLAIEKCETNLASTIVICFKDLIYKMIKDLNTSSIGKLEEIIPYELDNIEDRLSLEIFIASLDEVERDIVNKILEGKNPKILPSLQEKFSKYLSDNHGN